MRINIKRLKKKFTLADVIVFTLFAGPMGALALFLTLLFVLAIFGFIFLVIGGVLCITVIGLIAGIPLALLGLAILAFCGIVLYKGFLFVLLLGAIGGLLYGVSQLTNK